MFVSSINEIFQNVETHLIQKENVKASFSSLGAGLLEIPALIYEITKTAFKSLAFILQSPPLLVRAIVRKASGDKLKWQGLDFFHFVTVSSLKESAWTALKFIPSLGSSLLVGIISPQANLKFQHQLKFYDSSSDIKERTKNLILSDEDLEYIHHSEFTK